MGLVLKQADVRGLDRLPLIRINYVVAAGIAFIGCVALGQQHISRSTAVLAAVTGGLFVAGLFIWMKAIQAAGLALSVVAMRTAIVVPTLASILIWHESPTTVQLVGIGVALLALGLVLSDVLQSGAHAHSTSSVPASETRIVSRAAPLWLAGLFLADGLVMVPALVFRKQLPQNESLPFQTAIFLSAAFITTLLYYLGKPRANTQTLKFGAALGAANLGNYLFLVLALTALPGIVVYPAIAAGEVGLLALAGVLIWRERIGVRGWFGIGLAAVALILVQLGRAG
jgi:drug/metabolite transporter (DMT)-like permease